MEYITTRGFNLPNDRTQMEGLQWYNMWKSKLFPYNELLIGDILYWFDTTIQKLVWKTEILKVERFPYSNKQNIDVIHLNRLSKEYFDKSPDSGYYVGYKVKVLEKVNLDKPKDFKFPQIGWKRVDNEVASIWFNRQSYDDTNTLDDYMLNHYKSIAELLAHLNEKMKYVSPERVQKVVNTTIRKDTKIVKLLKQAADFKCQFPNCGNSIIKTEKDEFYIEVAHIKAVAENGQSILGNLVVLCPNHHKEFDYGKLKISQQTNDKLVGELNKKKFEINLIYHDR